MTERAPWRFDVPTQSEPVSPPPMTTTCLPVARSAGDAVSPATTLVLLRQKLHGEMNAVELAPRNRQVARLLGAAREHDRVEFGRPRPDDSSAVAACPARRAGPDVHRAELDAFGRHLLDATVDQVLLHLEVGDAVAQQPADAVALLEHDDRMARARELLRAGEPGRARAHDRDASCPSCVGAGRGFTQPSSHALSTIACSIDLMPTGSLLMLSVHASSHGAGHTRPVNSGKLLVECSVSIARCQSCW